MVSPAGNNTPPAAAASSSKDVPMQEAHVIATNQLSGCLELPIKKSSFVRRLLANVPRLSAGLLL